jgi:carboxypeptidase Taq
MHIFPIMLYLIYQEKKKGKNQMSELKTNLDFLYTTLKKVGLLSHAERIISFDLQTICPSKGRENEGNTSNYIASMLFALIKDPKFDEASEYCYKNIEQLEPLDQELVKSLHREYLRHKNITIEFQDEINKAQSDAYNHWLEAKDKDDFSLYAPYLKKIIELEKKKIDLLDEKDPIPYNNLIDLYERGMKIEDYDNFFGTIKDYLVKKLPSVIEDNKKVRVDFLSRDVPIHLQEQFSKYLLNTIGFDFERGALSTTEHPFTSPVAIDDNRVTTHYFLNNCVSNIFAIVHEGGHAIFGQCQPAESYDHFLDNSMSMGMHESVSRFYENVIGRSKEFIHCIYPEFQKIFGDIFSDVTENELYEGVNFVSPTYIRTDADEFTYTLHIIIRYELEKRIINEDLDVNELPKLWDDLYEKYLGIRPRNNKEGILQDVHWTGGFGYFPCYALGNAFNSIYFEKMQEELDVKNLVSTGDFKPILKWMTDNVFKKANYLDSKKWIEEMTGKQFGPDSFMRYLDKKY